MLLYFRCAHKLGSFKKYDFMLRESIEGCIFLGLTDLQLPVEQPSISFQTTVEGAYTRVNTYTATTQVFANGSTQQGKDRSHTTKSHTVDILPINQKERIN